MKRFLSMVLCFTMLFSLGGGVLAAENDGPEMKLTCQESEHSHRGMLRNLADTEVDLRARGIRPRDGARAGPRDG